MAARAVRHDSSQRVTRAARGPGAHAVEARRGRAVVRVVERDHQVGARVGRVGRVGRVERTRKVGTREVTPARVREVDAAHAGREAQLVEHLHGTGPRPGRAPTKASISRCTRRSDSRSSDEPSRRRRVADASACCPCVQGRRQRSARAAGRTRGTSCPRWPTPSGEFHEKRRAGARTLRVVGRRGPPACFVLGVWGKEKPNLL